MIVEIQRIFIIYFKQFFSLLSGVLWSNMSYREFRKAFFTFHVLLLKSKWWGYHVVKCYCLTKVGTILTRVDLTLIPFKVLRAVVSVVWLEKHFRSTFVVFAFFKAIIALIIACTELPYHCHRIWTLRALSKIHWLCIGKWRHDTLQMQFALGQKLSNKEGQRKESCTSFLSKQRISFWVC